VAYVGIGPAMVARSAGLDLRVVAANGVGQGSLLALGDLVAAFKAAPNPAEAFAAFHRTTGHPVRIATLPKGSVPDTVLRYWLNEVAQVPAEHVQILGVGEDRVQQALLAGTADAASVLEPILTVVQERVPTARVLITGGQMFPNQPGSILGMREQFIKASPATAQTLVALHVRATKLIEADPVRAAKNTLAVLGAGLISQETLERAFRSPAMRVIANPHIIEAAAEKLGAYQVQIGSLAKTVPMAELFDTSLYDALPTSTK
jgi:NitT/TauT family transport system substrate-binding protein